MARAAAVDEAREALTEEQWDEEWARIVAGRSSPLRVKALADEVKRLLAELGDARGNGAAALLGMARDVGAGVLQLVGRDTDDRVLWAVVLVDGEGADELLEAVTALEARWERETQG